MNIEQAVEDAIDHDVKFSKDSKEARDIVAMLQREMLNVRRLTRRYCIAHGMKRTFKETTIFHQETADLYERVIAAKVILKTPPKQA